MAVVAGALIMKTQRFLIAVEGGTKDGRTISAVEIAAMAKNFDYEGRVIPVTYDYFKWSPMLSEVVGIGTENVYGKLSLYVEVNATEELREIAERKVDHYLAPAINGCNSWATLVEVAVTQYSTIYDVDKLQFERGNHANAILRSR